MKTKLLRTLALALAGTMAFTFAAATESITAEETSDEEQITLTITWWGGDSRHAYTQELLDLYTELHPNITFEASPAGWDGYFEKLSTQAAAGTMPDIIQMDYSYIATYSNNNTLADLQEFVDSGIIDTTNLDDSILESGVINGSRTGIPLSTSILAISYDPEVIEAAGAELPTDDWTWEDYIEMNTVVSESTGQPSALCATNGAFGDLMQFQYWVRQHGEQLYSDDNKDLGFDDDSIIASYFQMYKDMSDANVTPDPDEQAQNTANGYEALPCFTGDAACTVEWNNATSRAASVNDHLKLALMPGANDGSNALWLKPGMFFSVSETSAHKEAAAEFINWFINSEEANAIILGERGTPVSSEIRAYLTESGLLSAQQEDMFAYVDLAAPISGETPAPDPAGTAELCTAFSNAGNSVLYGTATAEEAAATFHQQATEILTRNNQE